MAYRNLLIAATFAGLAGCLAGVGRAETIAVDNGIAVKQSDVATPTRGMSMDQVAAKFGAPASKVPAGRGRGGARATAAGPIIGITQESRRPCRPSDQIRFLAGGGGDLPVLPDLRTRPYGSFSAPPGIPFGRSGPLAGLPRAPKGVW